MGSATSADVSAQDEITALKLQNEKLNKELKQCRVSRGLCDSVLDTIGNTPIVKLNRLAPEGVSLYAKLEFFNPCGSVKDRLALGVIEAAERSGALKPGMTVIESTSGNTGIALAMVCAAKGYPCVMVMAGSFSLERRKVMRALGAKVVITPAANRGYGMASKAKELAETHGWFLTNQFETDANWQYHEKTTGPEILADFEGKRLDALVLGYGTGGTVHGCGKAIKASRPDVKIIVAEPSEAKLIASKLAQPRNTDGTPSQPHKAFTAHPIQGWVPDFIPLVAEKAFDSKVVDDLIEVSGAESIKTAKLAATKEGLWIGISAGGSLAAAIKVAEKAPKGSVILTVLADAGDRYLSTPLCADLIDDMNEEEIKISKSSPSQHM